MSSVADENDRRAAGEPTGKHAVPDPLAALDDDYVNAVVRAVWTVARKGAANPGERRLLCAAVELIPAEIPPPIPGGERSTELGMRFFLYARDLVVSARLGLAWFNLAASGTALRPTADGQLPSKPAEGSAVFVLGGLEDEPASPGLLSPTRIVPFVASWHDTPRVRHLIPRADPFSHLTAEERAGAVAWLRGETHVDFAELDEYWGSLHLIAPNPIFRSLHAAHLCRSMGAERSELVVALTARRGRRLTDLRLLVEEERATGWGVVAIAPVVGPVTRVPLPEALGTVRTCVLDPARGMLHDGGRAVFHPSFAFTANLVTQHRHVEVGPDDSYEVGLVGGHTVGGGVNSGHLRPRALVLHTAAARRQRRAIGRASQKWFRDQERDGRQALREAMKAVKGAVLVVDPYFGGDDVRRIIFAIPDPRIEVRILTSHMHLRRARRETPTRTDPVGNREARVVQVERREGAYFGHCIAEAGGPPHTNPIEVRVMRGKHPAIHDRFICDPERLWMLGSSINAFGSRGTMMIAVPDPEPVAQDLERVWDDSQPLDEYLKGDADAGDAES